jgi:hypothetical protein
VALVRTDVSEERRSLKGPHGVLFQNKDFFIYDPERLKLEIVKME